MCQELGRCYIETKGSNILELSLEVESFINSHPDINNQEIKGFVLKTIEKNNQFTINDFISFAQDKLKEATVRSLNAKTEGGKKIQEIECKFFNRVISSCSV